MSIGWPSCASSSRGREPTIGQSALSQHLKLLKACGILDSRKHGLSVTYSLADRRIEAVISTLKAQYCDDGAP